MKKTALNKNKSNQETAVKQTNKLKRWIIPALTACVVAGTVVIIGFLKPKQVSQTPDTPGFAIATSSSTIALPNPDIKSSGSLETHIKNRRVRRDYSEKPLTLKQISQLLWSAQGIITDWGDRAAPSVKSTYPLSIYVIANKVDGLKSGEYQYLSGDRVPEHKLIPIKEVDLREVLYDTVKESSLKNAAAVFVVTGNMSKMAESFGGIPHDREVYLEAGHVGQNLYLEVEALKLGMNIITSFEEAKLKDLVTIPNSDTIIYMVTLGNSK